MLKTLLKMLKTLIIQAHFISRNLLKSIIHTVCIYNPPLTTQQKKPLLQDFFHTKLLIYISHNTNLFNINIYYKLKKTILLHLLQNHIKFIKFRHKNITIQMNKKDKFKNCNSNNLENSN